MTQRTKTVRRRAVYPRCIDCGHAIRRPDLESWLSEFVRIASVEGVALAVTCPSCQPHFVLIKRLPDVELSCERSH